MEPNQEQPDPVVPLVEADPTSAELTEVFERITARRGFMPNVFRALANSPAAADRVAAVGAFARFESVLDDALREAVILTIATEVSCVYEWTHHYPIALKAGCSPELLADIEASRTGGEAPPLGPALRLARALVEPTPPAIELVREVQGHLGDRGLVDLVVTATYYGMVGRAMNALRVPLEDDVPRL